jgi:hypothetical protein
VARQRALQAALGMAMPLVVANRDLQRRPAQVQQNRRFPEQLPGRPAQRAGFDKRQHSGRAQQQLVLHPAPLSWAGHGVQSVKHSQLVVQRDQCIERARGHRRGHVRPLPSLQRPNHRRIVPLIPCDRHSASPPACAEYRIPNPKTASSALSPNVWRRTGTLAYSSGSPSSLQTVCRTDPPPAPPCEGGEFVGSSRCAAATNPEADASSSTWAAPTPSARRFAASFQSAGAAVKIAPAQMFLGRIATIWLIRASACRIPSLPRRTWPSPT